MIRRRRTDRPKFHRRILDHVFVLGNPQLVTRIEAFIRQLVSRSSLVIAMYWQRRNALCESHAHHALLDAFRTGDPDKAEDLMKGHLVDLLTQLDLRDTPEETRSLKDALLG